MIRWEVHKSWFYHYTDILVDIKQIEADGEELSENLVKYEIKDLLEDREFCDD